MSLYLDLYRVVLYWSAKPIFLKKGTGLYLLLCRHWVRCLAHGLTRGNVWTSVRLGPAFSHSDMPSFMLFISVYTFVGGLLSAVLAWHQQMKALVQEIDPTDDRSTDNHMRFCLYITLLCTVVWRFLFFHLHVVQQMYLVLSLLMNLHQVEIILLPCWSTWTTRRFMRFHLCLKYADIFLAHINQRLIGNPIWQAVMGRDSVKNWWSYMCMCNIFCVCMSWLIVLFCLEINTFLRTTSCYISTSAQIYSWYTWR